METKRKLMVFAPSGQVTWKRGEVEEGIETEVGGRVLHLGFEAAKYHAERVQRPDPGMMDLLKVVFPDVTWPITGYGDGVLHIAGLIDLTLKLRITHPSVAVNWQYPEQLLHPAHALRLGDLMLKMADR
jgi:hypothetical protein